MLRGNYIPDLSVKNNYAPSVEFYGVKALSGLMQEVYDGIYVTYQVLSPLRLELGQLREPHLQTVHLFLLNRVECLCEQRL